MERENDFVVERKKLTDIESEVESEASENVKPKPETELKDSDGEKDGEKISECLECSKDMKEGDEIELASDQDETGSQTPLVPETDKDVEKGEKLYVTADKRGEKSSCKRPLCWTLVGLVVAAVVVLIVLAATGILFSNSPTPVGGYNETISSARALGGIAQVHDHDQDHDHSLDHEHDQDSDQVHDHEHDDHESTMVQEASDRLAGEGKANDGKNVLPTVDESMYVPRTLEGEIKINNEDFVDALLNPGSIERKELAASLTRALAEAISNEEGGGNGDNELQIEIVNIQKGSIVVTYRVHWKPKYEVESNKEPLTSDTLNENVKNYLRQNADMLNNYHVATDSISTKKVLDLCKVNNNNCDQICEFDEVKLNFQCKCYPGYNLNQLTKKCEFGTSNTEDQEYKVLSIGSDHTTTQNIPDRDKTENVYISPHVNMYDWKEMSERQHTTEYLSIGMKENESNHQQTTNHPIEESEHEYEMKQYSSMNEVSKVIPLPEPTAEPEPQPEPQPEPTIEPQPEPTVDLHLQPEPQPEPEPLPVTPAEPQPIPTAEPEPISVSEPTAEPESQAKRVSALPKMETKTESSTKPTTELSPDSPPTTQSPSIFLTQDENRHKTNFNPESILATSSTEAESTTEIKSIDEINTSDMEKTMLQNDKSSFSNHETFSNHHIFTEENWNNMKTNLMPETTTNDSSEISHKEKDGQNPPVYIDDTKKNYRQNNSIENAYLFSRGRNIIIEPESQTEIFKSTTSETEMNTENENIFSISNEDTRDEADDYLSGDRKNESHISFKFLNTEITTQPTFELITKKKMDSYLQNESKEVSEEFIKTPSPTTTEKHILKINNTTDKTKSSNESELLPTIPAYENSEENFEISTTDSPNNANYNPIEVSIGDYAILKQNEVVTDSNFLDHASQVPTTIKPVDQENKINNKNIQFTYSSEITTSDPAEVPGSISGSDESQLSNKTEMMMIKNFQSPRGSVDQIINSEERFSLSGEDGLLENVDNEAITHNMLYNRSSKSFTSENEKNISSTDTSNNILLSTTEQINSDWLSDTADSTKSQHSTIVENDSSTKDHSSTIVKKENFEADYTNFMEPNGTADHNSPTYRFVHGLDIIQQESLKTENKSETGPNSFTAAFGTTTVSDYIYRNIQKQENETNLGIESTHGIITEPIDHVYGNPAPVWEEDESGMGKRSMQENDTNNGVKTNKIIMTPVVLHQVNNNITRDSETIITNETLNQDNTNATNINVTIYEIPNNNYSNVSLSEGTIGTLSIYEEHEHEMNPFLPEVENNKNLVEKLQEGHDLESLNANETHESHEDHVMSGTEREHDGKNETSNDRLEMSKNTPVTMNEMMTDEMNEISNNTTTNRTNTVSNQLASPDTTEIRTPRENESIPTFLLDTSDLFTSTTHATTESENSKELKLSTSIPNGILAETTIIPVPNDSLQVIPLLPETSSEEKHMIFKKSKIIDIHAINDISDTPKKSDKRTLDSKIESKFEK